MSIATRQALICKSVMIHKWRSDCGNSGLAEPASSRKLRDSADQASQRLMVDALLITL
jgi:hypothetical protein